MTLLGKHFTASKLDPAEAADASLLQWALPGSPALRCVDRLLELLSQPADVHWHALSLRSWPRETELLAVSCHSYMVAELLLRCWDVLQQWPFRGMRVASLFPEEARASTSTEWQQACEFCLDPFSAAYKALAFAAEDGTEPPGVLAGPVHQSLQETYAALPVTNLQTEDTPRQFVQCLRRADLNGFASRIAFLQYGPGPHGHGHFMQCTTSG